MSNEKLNAILVRKVQQIEAAYEIKLKDQKPLILEAACKFVKEQTENVTKLLT